MEVGVGTYQFDDSSADSDELDLDLGDITTGELNLPRDLQFHIGEGLF